MLRHANIMLIDEVGVDARTNWRFDGRGETDVQGGHYIRRYCYHRK